MKKLILALSSLLLLSFGGIASAETTEGTISLEIGNTQAQIHGKNVTMPVPARSIDGRTLVPLRFVGEAFGCDVQWDNSTQTALLKLINHEVHVPIGKKFAVINGEQLPVQVPAQTINGSTYVPLRFIGESLGAKVDFNSSSQQIIITTKIYTNNAQGFKMILPSGWTVDEETTEEVSFIIPGEGYCTVGFADKGEGITPDNFNIFADEWLKEYSDKDIITEGTEGVIAGVVFKEDELIQLHSTKLLDNGIFIFVAAYPEATLDANVARQSELALNSLTN